MDKQQKLKIALPVLFAVIVIVYWPVIFGSGPKSKEDTGGNIRVSVSGVSDTAGSDLVLLAQTGSRKRAKTQFEKWGRNPFIPGNDPKVLTVEGILWDENNPQAIVSGDMVGVGGKFGPHTISAIKPDKVIIKTDSGEIELGLGEGKEF